MSIPSVGRPVPIYNPNDFEGYIKDYLDLYLLPRNYRTDPGMSNNNLVFRENAEFWNHLLTQRTYPGKKYHLLNFGLMEWLPSSPGLFHTLEAFKLREYSLGRSREYAQYQPENEIGKKFVELRPDDKMGMVRGGFGSVRLAPKNINGKELFFLCATSSLVSHEGIPIIVNRDVFESALNELSSNRILVADIYGELKLITSDMSVISLKYEQNIPKYCLEVNQIIPKFNISGSKGIISAAITFAPNIENYFSSNYYYSFCTFSPTRDDSSVRDAASWLNGYAIRYSDVPEPVILCDFDETVNHFKDVRLPLKELMQGKLSAENLMRYKEMLHLEFNGDIFSNITNSIIINRSTIDNSSNKTQDNG